MLQKRGTRVLQEESESEASNYEGASLDLRAQNDPLYDAPLETVAYSQRKGRRRRRYSTSSESSGASSVSTTAGSDGTTGDDEDDSRNGRGGVSYLGICLVALLLVGFGLGLWYYVEHDNSSPDTISQESSTNFQSSAMAGNSIPTESTGALNSVNPVANSPAIPAIISSGSVMSKSAAPPKYVDSLLSR